MRSLESSPIAKTVMAVILFALIVGGWMLFTRYRDASAILPDDKASTSAVRQPCALWFVGSSSINRWRSLDRDMAPWIAHNRGIDGATFAEILPRFANVQAVRPEAIILYAGENDIAQGVPLRMIVRQLAAFLALRSQIMGDVPVLVLSAKPSPGRWASLADQHILSDAARRLLGRFPNSYYADITTPLLQGGKLGDNYHADGVHMNDAGYRIWANVVQRRLTQVLPAATIRRCMPA
ncbi:GDSL-type esterase/lipase family protein [Sphingobium sp. AN558]|uniref:GDSL-type esterase/lipase family protein n=1 Tax=Sphingobium sp. AN558 TaxID=3133442 RepID=UPI0030C268A4